jgi:hypothetical protein
MRRGPGSLRRARSRSRVRIEATSTSMRLPQVKREGRRDGLGSAGPGYNLGLVAHHQPPDRPERDPGWLPPCSWPTTTPTSSASSSSTCGWKASRSSPPETAWTRSQGRHRLARPGPARCPDAQPRRLHHLRTDPCRCQTGRGPGDHGDRRLRLGGRGGSPPGWSQRPPGEAVSPRHAPRHGQGHARLARATAAPTLQPLPPRGKWSGQAGCQVSTPAVDRDLHGAVACRR